MNIQRKLELARQAIASIATHDDEDSAVLDAALLEVEKAAADARGVLARAVSDRIAAAIDPE